MASNLIVEAVLAEEALLVEIEVDTEVTEVGTLEVTVVVDLEEEDFEVEVVEVADKDLVEAAVREVAEAADREVVWLAETEEEGVEVLEGEVEEAEEVVVQDLGVGEIMIEVDMVIIEITVAQELKGAGLALIKEGLITVIFHMELKDLVVTAMKIILRGFEEVKICNVSLNSSRGHHCNHPKAVAGGNL